MYDAAQWDKRGQAQTLTGICIELGRVHSTELLEFMPAVGSLVITSC